jgi:sugar phosphate isomerase/epimerase
MSVIKLAANLHTVRDYCSNEDNLFQTLKRIKTIGFDGIEITGLSKIIKPDTLAQIVKEVGLDICAVHSYFYRTISNLDDMIKEAQTLGCSIISIDTISSDFYGVGPEAIAQKSGVKNDKNDVITVHSGYHRYIKFVEPIVEKLKNAGIKYAYNVQMHEFIKYEGIHGFDIIFNQTDPTNFNFIMDTYWLHHAGLNTKDYILKVSGRMDIIRFRDMKITAGVEDFFTPLRHECEVGEGTYCFKPIIDAIKETGVKWISIRQDFHSKDPFESLAISYNNTRAML